MEFPRFTIELYQDRLEIERSQFEKHIRNHEKNMTAAKLKWESISKEKGTLKELLFEERVLNEKAGLKCHKLSQKLKDTERQLEEACTHLQTIIVDGNVLCANEIKQMEISREHEIEKLKLQSDENNEMYINLLKSRKEINKELNENNKIIEALKGKLTKEIIKKT